MAEQHRRKKSPELVRKSLLDNAGSQAARQGLASISVNAVAAASGVTKGGLFHHFPTKRALVEAVCGELLNALDARIDSAIEPDETVPGRFTRAYIEAAFADDGQLVVEWSAIWLSVATDPELKMIWTEWLGARLRQHRSTDSGQAYEVARYAADGVWLSDLTVAENESRSDRRRMKARILQLTYPDAPRQEDG